MLTNLSDHFCNMLHCTTACHAICHVLPCRVNIYPLVSVLVIIQLLLQDGTQTWRLEEPHDWFSVWGRGVGRVCMTLTSPRGPGFLTRPVLRWCTVFHRTPGCCVGSEPPSSGTPNSSCPTGTCSTTRRPPSHPTQCHLRYVK